MKTTFTFLITLIFLQAFNVIAQNAFWAKGFATGTCDMLTTDASGNIYAAAVFSDTIEIDGVEITLKIHITVGWQNLILPENYNGS